METATPKGDIKGPERRVCQYQRPADAREQWGSRQRERERE